MDIIKEKLEEFLMIIARSNGFLSWEEVQQKYSKEIEQALNEVREKTIREINEINFYGWNEETQRMIKDRINKLII